MSQNLAENEPIPKDTESKDAYNPTTEERADVKLVNKLFEKSKTWRKQYDEKWTDNYKMFRGKQWAEQRPTYRHSEVINMIFRSIQSVVPIITDSRPRFDFLPQDPSDNELAKILAEVAESDWQKNNWLMQLTEIVYDYHLYGTAYGDVQFDQGLEHGIGSITFNSADPFYCFPDPNARNINEPRSRYFIYAEPIDVDILKKEFPDKKHLIKSDMIDLVGGNKLHLNDARFISANDTASTVDVSTNTFDLNSSNKALKITCYLHCDDSIEEAVNGEGSEMGEQASVEYQTKLKYPKGRKIIIVNNMRMFEGPIPYDDGKFPYAKIVNYMLPREFYGISEVEQLSSPQKIFNKLISFALDVLTLMGNPVWVVGTDSGVDVDNLFNRPGLIIEKEPNTDVHREPGVELQPYVLQMIDKMAGYFNDQSGDNDVSRGVNPGGITAASAIQDLQEAAQTRLRLKSRILDSFLQEIGQLYVSRIFQFYSAPRIFRLTHEEGAQKYFKFHIDTKMDEAGDVIVNEAGDPQRIARVTEYNQDPATGQLGEGNMSEYEVTAEFDVRVTTGSTLPFAKKEKYQLAKDMFQLGVIDAEELLKSAEWPNWEAVMGRMKEQQAQQAQAQQGSGPGGPPPGPPPQGH